MKIFWRITSELESDFMDEYKGKYRCPLCSSGMDLVGIPTELESGYTKTHFMNVCWNCKRVFMIVEGIMQDCRD